MEEGNIFPNASISGFPSLALGKYVPVVTHSLLSNLITTLFQAGLGRLGGGC